MKTIELNIEKWKPGSILFITGNSGAGKTTLSQKLSKEPDVVYLNLDIFFVAAKMTKEDFIIYLENYDIEKETKLQMINYFKTLNEAYFNYYLPPKMDHSKFILLSSYAFDFVRFLYKFIQNSTKKYILESTAIYMMSPSYFINKPIILLGTSYFISQWRGITRAIKRKVSFKNFNNIFKNRILTMFNKNNSLYIQHKEYNEFRDKVIKLNKQE